MSMYLVDASLTPATFSAFKQVGAGKSRHGKAAKAISNQDPNEHFRSTSLPFRSSRSSSRPATAQSSSSSTTTMYSSFQHRRRTVSASRLNTRKNKSMQNVSLSVVSAFFSKGASTSSSEPSTVISPPSPDSSSIIHICGSGSGLHSYSTSFDSSAECTSEYNKPVLSHSGSLESLRSAGHGASHRRPFVTSPIAKGFFGTFQQPTSQPQSKRSKHKRLLKWPNSNENDRGRCLSPFDLTRDDWDDKYIENDACSAVSSIHFANDPDEKPPQKEKKRSSLNQSHLPEYDYDPYHDQDQDPMDPGSASTIETVIEGEDVEAEDEFHKYLKHNAKLLRMLGSQGSMSPYNNHHHRRYSSVPVPIPSTTQSSDHRSDPDLTARTPTEESPISPSNATRTSRSSTTLSRRDLRNHRRQSNLFRSSFDSISQFLRPQGGGGGARKDPLLRNLVTFSLDELSTTRTSASQSSFNSPTTSQDTSRIKSILNLRPNRSSLVSNETFSDLHRLPPLLTDSFSEFQISESGPSSDKPHHVQQQQQQQQQPQQQQHTEEVRPLSTMGTFSLVGIGEEFEIDPNASTDTLVSPIVFADPTRPWYASEDKHFGSAFSLEKSLGDDGQEVEGMEGKRGVRTIFVSRDGEDGGAGRGRQREDKDEGNHSKLKKPSSLSRKSRVYTSGEVALKTPRPHPRPGSISLNDDSLSGRLIKQPASPDDGIIRLVGQSRTRDEESSTWVGEWNVDDMQDVIRHLRTLR